MPLTAALDGQLLRAPQITAEEWAALRGRDLVMPCGARGIAKRSRLGTRYFAHWRADCGFDHKPETEEHLGAKQAIIAAATAAGWDARDEVRAADGAWIADVLVTRGDRRIAFEVQWSRQGFDDYVRRTERYAQAGVEAVWLIRHMTPLLAASQPVIELLPHRPGGNVEHHVIRPGADGPVLLSGVIAAYLDGRLAFAPRRPGLATTRVAWGLEECWKCQGHSVIFSPSDIQSVRCHDCGHRTMAERGVTAFARFIQAEAAAGAPDAPMARLALRRTTKHPEGEIVFTCPHCSALFGWNYVDSLWEDDSAGRLTVPVGDSAGQAHWCRIGDPREERPWSTRPHGNWKTMAASRKARLSREKLLLPASAMSPEQRVFAREAIGDLRRH